ncbi:MAG: radical SAM family heme chaperone HemW [Tannerella sp.]|nr:radical SAM family heme chaperone HemW [Tannerella sp.]
MNQSLYIHIPFCKQRCIYCDFFTQTDMHRLDDYVQALTEELEIRCNYLNYNQIETIYFGGGTPSLLQQPHFERIFETIKSVYTIADNPEITIEANPDDLTTDYIEMLIHQLFNRISIGVQSFKDSDLRFLNRRHTAGQAIDAITQCKAKGLTNINIDLIYGLPGQTTDDWKQNLETAIKLGVTHISAYNLSYEPSTPLCRMKERGEVTPTDDELCETLFRLTNSILQKAGYDRYEISNYALRTKEFPEGMIARHNSSYWFGTPYIGLGAGAHSFNGANRSWNVSDLDEYINGVKQGLMPCKTEQLDNKTSYNDYIITRLRTKWGVSTEEIRSRFGEEIFRRFSAKMKHFENLNILKSEGSKVKVAEEKIFISDFIMRELIE